MTAPATLSAREVRAAKKTLYTLSFYEFTKAAWSVIDPGSSFKDNWHIEVLCDHLQATVDPTFATARGVDPADPLIRLLINICPGSGKSQIINVLFPAWVWTHSPQKRIISTSHKEKLAIRDSTKTRRLIESDWYQAFWPTQLRDDQNAKAAFENTSFGAREASPFSSITGARGNIVVVDDPHSVDDAKSDAHRASAVETFRETIPSRINDPATDIIIVVMQRLHNDDVSGFILDTPDLGYDHLCIPYLCDGEDRPATKLGWKDHRKEGDFMFPQHFGQSFIKMQKAALGPYGFAGQYQQNPVPVGEGFLQVDWFKRYKPDELPAKDRLHFYMTSDHAPGGSGDYNVFRIWAVDECKHLWLVDSFRRKCLMDEAMGIARDPASGRVKLRAEGALPLIKKWQPLKWFPENDNTWAAMKAFVQGWMLETDTFTMIDPLPTKGSGDKVGKAQSYQAMAAQGLIHLPEGPVGDEALEEYRRFPAGRHDDQVDADGAIARAMATAPAWMVPEPEGEVDDWKWGAKRVYDPTANFFG